MERKLNFFGAQITKELGAIQLERKDDTELTLHTLQEAGNMDMRSNVQMDELENQFDEIEKELIQVRRLRSSPFLNLHTGQQQPRTTDQKLQRAYWAPKHAHEGFRLLLWGDLT